MATTSTVSIQDFNRKFSENEHLRPYAEKATKEGVPLSPSSLEINGYLDPKLVNTYNRILEGNFNGAVSRKKQTGVSYRSSHLYSLATPNGSKDLFTCIDDKNFNETYIFSDPSVDEAFSPMGTVAPLKCPDGNPLTQDVRKDEYRRVLEFQKTTTEMQINHLKKGLEPYYQRIINQGEEIIASGVYDRLSQLAAKLAPGEFDDYQKFSREIEELVLSSADIPEQEELLKKRDAYVEARPDLKNFLDALKNLPAIGNYVAVNVEGAQAAIDSNRELMKPHTEKRLRLEQRLRLINMELELLKD